MYHALPLSSDRAAGHKTGFARMRAGHDPTENKMEESMKDSSPKAVDFLGHQINCIQDAEGNSYVPLKWLCEILGIDDQRQRWKVKHIYNYDWKMLAVKGADGRHRKMLCLPVKQACLWFYLANPNMVRPEIKERLLEYQEESTTVLRHSMQYGFTLNPRVPAEEIESAVREPLERKMRETFPDRHDPQQWRLELLARELLLFRQFDNEAPPYRDKASECMDVAIGRYMEWVIRHGYDPFYYRRALNPKTSLIESLR
jgi:hypothetical protein